MLKMVRVKVCSLVLMQSLMASPIIEEKVFNQPIQSMSIELDEGNISVYGHTDGDKTSIMVIAKKFKAGCKHTVKIDRNELHIQNHVKFGGCRTDYDIFVPSHINLDTNTGGSSTSVSNVKGLIGINSGGGKVSVDKPESSVQINQSHGHVKISYESIPRNPVNVNVNAFGGTIGLAIPSESTIRYKGAGSFMSNFNSDFPNSRRDFNFDATINCSNGLVNIYASK